ncbi:MAG: response regulator, partial [Firmicutes bacterium]|nr:response regulator [Bacillota bacterium]
SDAFTTTAITSNTGESTIKASAMRTGQAGLEAAHRLRPNLALLDVYLPDLDGLGVLREIRGLGLPVDVILVTAAHDTFTLQNAFRYGAIDYIIKPFKFERLKAALETYAVLYHRMHAPAPLCQEEVDRLLCHHLLPRELPKGLQEVTLRQIMLLLIRESRAWSAEEVASRLGVARVTARRYLEFLHEDGQVELELQYGAVGRPVKRYRLLQLPRPPQEQ